MFANKQQIELLNSLAALQLSCGRASKALPLLKLSNHLSPDEAQTKYLLSKAYFLIGDLDASRLHFENFESLSVRSLTLKEFLFKSFLLLREGYVSEAKKLFYYTLKNKSS